MYDKESMTTMVPKAFVVYEGSAISANP
jgi:hypothetical protein